MNRLLQKLLFSRINKKIKHLERLKESTSAKLSLMENAKIFSQNSRIDFAIKVLKEL